MIRKGQVGSPCSTASSTDLLAGRGETIRPREHRHQLKQLQLQLLVYGHEWADNLYDGPLPNPGRHIYFDDAQISTASFHNPLPFLSELSAKTAALPPFTCPLRPLDGCPAGIGFIPPPVGITVSGVYGFP